MKKIVVCGNSHVANLKDAWNESTDRRLPEGISDFEVAGASGRNLTKRFFEAGADHIDIRLELKDEAAEPRLLRIEKNGECIYAFHLFFTQHLISKGEWGKFAPMEVANGSEAPLSTAVLNRMFDSHNRFIMEFIGQVHRLGVPFYVLETPRLFSSGVGRMCRLRNYRREVVGRVEELFRNRWKDALARSGIRLLEIPPECLDGERMMKEEYSNNREGDHFHANVNFGKVVLRQLFEAVESAGARG